MDQKRIFRGKMMSKVKHGPIPLVYPIPITLVGAMVAGRPNYTTIGDCGLAGIRPPLVFVSSHRDHHINKGIIKNRTFSINFPNTKLLDKTDYCGIVSGRDVDKSALFQTFYGELKSAPMISECPINLECKVLKDFLIQHRQIFIGEVVQCHADEGLIIQLEEGKAITDMKRLDPIIYSLDNKYYSIGKTIGTGYKEGKKISK
jgi:flavin reductase (DIM6/NTAB) family NADH-FMN oxidoreductase RutF